MIIAIIYLLYIDILCLSSLTKYLIRYYDYYYSPINLDSSKGAPGGIIQNLKAVPESHFL